MTNIKNYMMTKKLLIIAARKVIQCKIMYKKVAGNIRLQNCCIPQKLFK